MSNNMDKKIICLMGPTAVGKTAVAEELTARMQVEIISVDSTLVYKGMDIGTGKPSAEVLAKAPHHLIDIREPKEVYSAYEFVQDVQDLIALILAKGKIPLLVGGTMLYYKSLLRGIDKLPEANIDLREEFTKEAELHGWEALHAKLAEIDRITADKLHPRDSQRIQRALEVYHLTGEPLSKLKTLEKRKPELPYQSVNYAMVPQNRAELHNRIEQRFLAMLQDGFIEEVSGLKARAELNLNLPAMRAVGYRQIWEYLDGVYSKEEMIERALAATRQLAKRQLTWLRSWPEVTNLEIVEYSAKEGADLLIKHLRDFA